MSRAPLTCGRCPKFRHDIAVCLHYARTIAEDHPLCKYGRLFIHQLQARLSMARLRARRKDKES